MDGFSKVALLAVSVLVLGLANFAAADVTSVLDGASGSLDASVSASVGASVSPTPSPEASVAASVSASPSPSGDEGRQPGGRNQREARKERRDELRNQTQTRIAEVKDRVQEIRANVTARVQEVREQVKDKLESLREQRQEQLDAARDLRANLSVRVEALREHASANASARAELKDKLNLQLMAEYHFRIQLAHRLEVEGANATLVANFVAFAEDNWNHYSNSTNATERRALVKAFNLRWAEFRKAVVQDVMASKVAAAVNASRQALARMDAVVLKLTAAGFNTTVLANESARISVMLDSVVSAPDLPTAAFRLRQAHNALVHLRNAIQRTVNRELVEAFHEEREPAAGSDEDLALGSPTATPSLSASPAASEAAASPSSPPTGGDVGASGSGTANGSANASA